VLCQYLWKWLSTSSSKVWVKKLCLFIADNTNYFGCECMMCDFRCAEGFVEISTFKSVVVRGSKWSYMEGPCAQLCTMSFFQHGWPNWPILVYPWFLLVNNVCCMGNL
jgi:hypothetical protein